MKILITGATGFVGRHLVKSLKNQGVELTLVARSSHINQSNIRYLYSDLNTNFDWQSSLTDCDIVIHLAGRAHVMKEEAGNPYQAYAEINIEATKRLAEQAALYGVKRFIFLSSVKVNGERTDSVAFTETDIPQPEDDYGKTKYEAEKALSIIAKETGMEVVIIRPPLVYGTDVKANFKNLIKLSQLSIPLPFGAIHNKRSLIYIENLIDFIVLCTHQPKAANETFLISDDADVSTTQLIKYIREANGQKSWLLPVPKSWLTCVFKLISKSSLSDRLCGNLQVDITKAKTLLNWKPPYSVKEGIARTVSNDK